MKNSLLLILLVCLLFDCKDKNREPDPLPEVAGLVSKWRLASYEYKRNDSTFIEPAKGGTYILAFRYDGTPVDSLGRGLCCGPSSFLLNGVEFKINPLGEAPPYNPGCSLVDCAACPQWTLTQEGDQLIVETCNNFPRSIYQRIK